MVSVVPAAVSFILMNWFFIAIKEIREKFFVFCQVGSTLSYCLI